MLLTTSARPNLSLRKLVVNLLREFACLTCFLCKLFLYKFPAPNRMRACSVQVHTSTCMNLHQMLTQETCTGLLYECLESVIQQSVEIFLGTVAGPPVNSIKPWTWNGVFVQQNIVVSISLSSKDIIFKINHLWDNIVEYLDHKARNTAGVQQWGGPKTQVYGLVNSTRCTDEVKLYVTKVKWLCT